MVFQSRAPLDDHEEPGSPPQSSGSPFSSMLQLFGEFLSPKIQEVLEVKDFRLTSATVLSRDQARALASCAVTIRNHWSHSSLVEAAAQIFQGNLDVVKLVERKAAAWLHRKSELFPSLPSSRLQPRKLWWIDGWHGSGVRPLSLLRSPG